MGTPIFLVKRASNSQDTVDYIVQRAARKNSSGFPGLSRRFSPAVFKAEIKLSGERVAARFPCGAESLAVYRAVYKCIASRCRRGATTSYEGKISTATCTSDYVNLLACWSRYFPESVPDGYIGVGYSLFYYLLLSLLLAKNLVLWLKKTTQKEAHCENRTVNVYTILQQWRSQSGA